MRVAYLIMAHKYPLQVAALVKTLSVPDTVFFIHLDRKSGAEIETVLRRELAELDNCIFMPRQDVHWGRFSVVEVQLRAIALAEDPGLDPDHLVFLTGQDLPIKPPELIAARLSGEADRAFVKYVAFPDYEWLPNERGGLSRHDRISIPYRHGGMRPLPIPRRILRGYQPYGGSAHCRLGRPHRRYIHQQVTEDPRVVRYFKRANVPDETFFQTMLMNSPLRGSVVNDDLLFSRWQPGANHPDLLYESDLDEMARSDAFFARKFDFTETPGILDAVRSRLLG